MTARTQQTTADGPTDRVDGVATPRLIITGGGRPDPARLAALVIALTPARTTPPPTGPPAWRRAALLEGIGGPAILAPGDLDVADRRR